MQCKFSFKKIGLSKKKKKHITTEKEGSIVRNANVVKPIIVN